jgi:hypothetical protein
MLHLDRTRSKKWLIALLVVAVAGAAWWGWRASRQASGGEGAAGGTFPWSRADQSAGDGTAGNKWTNLVSKQTAPDQRPDFLTEEEWTSLREALKDTPNREREQARIIEYLRFQKQFQRWQALRDSHDTAQRQALAKELLDGVPQRLAQREMSAGEAQLLQSTLLEELVPDAQQRQARLQVERQRLATQPTEAEVAAQRQDTVKQQDYKRREAEIISQWQAMPVDQRDQRWLESQLDAARRAAYEGR